MLIGIAAPASGAKAAIGRDIHRSAEIAAAHINADGGVHGRPVEIVPVDDGCSAQQAKTAARTLAGQKVALVIGHPCENAAIAAARVYAEAGIVFIASATRHPELTEKRAGAAVFRLAGRDDRQGKTVAAFLVRQFHNQPLAIVTDGSRYAKRLGNDALSAMKEAGAGNVMRATVKGGQKEYGKLVDRLAKAQTSAVFFAGFPMEGALLLRQMRAAGLTTEFIGSDALATQSFAETAGTAAADAVALLPHNAAQAAAESPKRIARSPDGATTAAHISAYAAIEAWHAAARQVGSIEAAAVAEALQQGTFDTALGTISFDEIGDARVRSYDMVRWKNGAWRVQY